MTKDLARQANYPCDCVRVHVTPIMHAHLVPTFKLVAFTQDVNIPPSSSYCEPPLAY